ncbi:MAG TPA: hypothetical protein VJT74_13310 [Pyrinomonadaceae bacterium]|nr:hypothetical protein [Pyrinomonadaceae bacterium]
MKRCPVCQRRYDETLAFCLEDGARLVSVSSAADDQPATIIMPDPRVTAPTPPRPETFPQPQPQPYTQPPPMWAPAPAPQPYATTPAGRGRGLAVTSLVMAISAFAIFGFCIIAGAAGVNNNLIGGVFILSVLLTLVGAILGIVATSKSSRDPSPHNSKAMAVVALALNGFYLVLVIIFLILGALIT